MMIGKRFLVLLSLTILINCIISLVPSSCHTEAGKEENERIGHSGGLRGGRRHHPDDDNDDTWEDKKEGTGRGGGSNEDEDYDEEDDDDHSSDHLLDERVDNFLDDTVHLINQGGHVLSQHLSKFNDPKWKNSKNGANSKASSSAQSSYGQKSVTNIHANATGIWIGYGKAIQKIIDTFIRQSLPRILEASYSTNVSTECTGAILQNVNWPPKTRTLGHEDDRRHGASNSCWYFGWNNHRFWIL